MYYPDKYKEHNESLNRFVEHFNSFLKKENWKIIIDINKEETFKDDGIITDQITGNKILFDWEKRNTHYCCCGFPFSTLSQFERKVKKAGISLSIQCSKDEKCFCIGWHSDFIKEQLEKIGSVTANGTKEYAGKRTTTHFKEIKYAEINIFYKILRKAFDEKQFNKNSFIQLKEKESPKELFLF